VPTEEQVKKRAKELDDKVTEPERQSQADKLIELARKEKVSLFRDPDNASYADVVVRDHRETWLLRSSGFRKWFRGRYYLRFKSAPNRDALDTAIETLDAQAQFECQTMREVWLRVAYHDGKIYYDLCNDDWQVVEISASGWKVIKKAPVRFRRTPSSRPQGASDQRNLEIFLRPRTPSDHRALRRRWRGQDVNRADHCGAGRPERWARA